MEGRDHNRHQLTGVVTHIDEVKQVTQFMKKRSFKIKFTDTDFTGKIRERVIKFDTINYGIQNLDPVRVDNLVSVDFYLEGRDYEKENDDGTTKTLNFTSIVAYNIEILSDPVRDTDEDRKAIVTDSGRVYKPSEATDEELARMMEAHGHVLEGDHSDTSLFPKVNKTPDRFGKPEDEEFNDLPF